jgi:hypothetical protein
MPTSGQNKAGTSYKTNLNNYILLGFVVLNHESIALEQCFGQWVQGFFNF